MKIGVIGIGTMGTGIVTNLNQSGHRVIAYNRTPNRPGVEAVRQVGVPIASSIHETVCDAEIVITSLGNEQDVEAVLFSSGGIADSVNPGTLVIDTSTIGPKAAKEFGLKLQDRGIRFLDAPVSGSDTGARNGTLSIMVGGERQDFENCRAVLEGLGKPFYCGPTGNGQAVKACNQIMCSLNMVGLSEAFRLAEQQGIDPNLVVEVCSRGAAASWALSNLAPRLINGDLHSGFKIVHMRKDLRLVRESLQSSELPGVELADQLFQQIETMDDGQGGSLATQAMIRAYREIERV